MAGLCSPETEPGRGPVFQTRTRGPGRGQPGELVQAAQMPGALGSPWDLVITCRFGFHRSGLGRGSLSDELPDSATAVGPWPGEAGGAGEPL